MTVLQYPLSMRFKLVALAPRIFVNDAANKEVLFVHQKTWKLKEDILLYRDNSKKDVVFRIRADRIIDFSATYRFYDGAGTGSYGLVKRKGMRSLWRATYFADDAAGNTTHHLKEDNPWTKVWDALFAEVPFLGLLGGFFFNPSYTCYRGTNREDESQPVMRLKKERAFFESKYTIELANPNISPDEEVRALLSLIMLVQLERRRG